MKTVQNYKDIFETLIWKINYNDNDFLRIFNISLNDFNDIIYEDNNASKKLMLKKIEVNLYNDWNWYYINKDELENYNLILEISFKDYETNDWKIYLYWIENCNINNNKLLLDIYYRFDYAKSLLDEYEFYEYENVLINLLVSKFYLYTMKEFNLWEYFYNKAKQSL